MPYVIGIDGGGTKTEAVVLNEQKSQMASAAAGATNPFAVPWEQVDRHLRELFTAIMSDPALPPAACSAICLGMAGVDAADEKRKISGMLGDICRQHGLQVPVYVYNDAEIVLMGTLGKPTGIVAIAGTGSIVYGITPDGAKYRVGGWGHLLGDEGSGYAIGLETLRAVMKSFDGRIGPTRLNSMVCTALGLSGAEELKNWIYRPDIRKQDIAAFAKLCIEADALGDPTAARILQTAAGELAVLAETLIRKSSEFDQAELVASGSIFHRCPLFVETFRRLLGEAFPRLVIHLSANSAAYGAALSALAKVNGQG